MSMPWAVLAITKGAKHLVFVGDRNQLEPVTRVDNPDAVLTTSVIDFLADTPAAFVTLKV